MRWIWVCVGAFLGAGIPACLMFAMQWAWGRTLSSVGCAIIGGVVGLVFGRTKVRAAKHVLARREMERRIEAHARDLSLLNEVSRALLFGMGVQETAEYVCGLAVERLGHKAAWIGLVHEGGDGITPLTVFGKCTLPDDFALRRESEPDSIRSALRNARAVIDQDLQTDPRHPARDAARGEGYRSAATLPLISGDKVLGVMNVYDALPNSFSEESTSLLQSLANLVAIAISAAQASEELKQRAAELEVAVVHRTTELRAAEEARKQQAELAHLLRVNIMSQMASGLAHEINQPLTAISNFAGAALRLEQDGKLSGPKVREILTDVHHQAHRAGEVVRRLRSFIRKRPGELAWEDLNAIVSDALALMNPEMRRARVELKFNPAAELTPIEMDAIQIQQVVVNLVQNAIEAMEENSHQPRTLTVAIMRSDGQVLTRVTDTGKGILARDLAKIFDSFYSTKAAGLGMGLNISRSIIESHGGSLNASNNGHDGGATFEFVLPLSPAHTSQRLVVGASRRDPVGHEHSK